MKDNKEDDKDLKKGGPFKKASLSKIFSGLLIGLLLSGYALFLNWFLTQTTGKTEFGYFIAKLVRFVADHPIVEYIGIILIISVLAFRYRYLAYTLFGKLNRIHSSEIRMVGNQGCSTIFTILAIMCILYSVPVIILIWLLNPTNLKKPILVTVLILSIVISIFFYDKEKLPTLADKVTYFAGVTLTPVGILSFLI
jgi:hypothetical protein